MTVNMELETKKLTENAVEDMFRLYRCDRAEIEETLKASGDSISPLVNLKNINKNILESGELLSIAYFALEGYDAQSQVASLQSELFRSSGDCFITVNNFKQQTQAAVNTINRTYDLLLQASEKRAFNKLSQISKQADEMAAKTSELKGVFEGLADSARSALAKSVDEKNKASQTVRELTSASQKLQADIAGREAKNEGYISAIATYERKYNEEKASEKSAETKQFVLDIVGVASNMVGGIANAFSGGLGALANTTAAAAKSTKPSGSANQSAALNSQIATKETQKEQLQEKLDKQNGELDELVDELEQLETAQGEAEEDLEAAKDPEKKVAVKAGDSADVKKVKKNINNKKREIATTQGKLEAASAALAKLSEGLYRAGDAAMEAANGLQKAIDNHHTTALKIFEAQHELETARIENLGAMKQFAKMVENIKLDTESQETAVKTLSYAVAALQRVGVSLEQTRLFWRELSEYCKLLNTANISEEVNEILEYDEDPAARIEEYQSPYFRSIILRLTCDWYAIHQLCSEFVTEGRSDMEALEKKMGESHFGEYAREAAKEKAKQFLQELDAEISASERKKKQLETAKTLAEAANKTK